jgi:alpha-galactosidase
MIQGEEMEMEKPNSRRVYGVIPAIFILSFTVISFSGLLAPRAAYALDNGLARTPPMGWNDWNAFGCHVNAALVKESARAMVKSGMKAAGYQYVNIDDCWMTHQRNAQGQLVPDPKKFPHGIQAVADYVHSLGLKLGIYEDAGSETCAEYPGSFGHYKQDAKSFASWGVDYLKFDWCHVPKGHKPKVLYTKMRDALAATGRDIVFSLCDWGVDDPWQWGPKIGNLWRTTHDIKDRYQSMLGIYRQNVKLARYAGPGHWNDPDMLEIGNGGMSETEYKSEFSLWAEMAAPLLAGTDLRHLSAATRAILTNRAVIAVDQDPLGVQGRRIQTNEATQDILVKPLASGDRAVVFFNAGSQPATMHTTIKKIGFTDPKPGTMYALHDLWSTSTTRAKKTIRARVAAHGVVMYRVHPLATRQ